ncbi:MAG: transcription antitermination factor NusB [Termitinemataceae bacterium]|nr:MAG: transcription antitermination factor NusB [Termitinemataceae bacterium]
MSRSKARIVAFQSIFAWEACGQQLTEGLTDFEWLETAERNALNPVDFDFARLLIAGTVENIKEIDALIISLLLNWEIGRIKRVDLAILRLSVYSLLYKKEIPPSVVIEEAVKIAVEYGTDDSFKFVNGILDSARKQLEMPSTTSCAGAQLRCHS